MTVDAAGNLLSLSYTQPRFTPEERGILFASWMADQEPVGRHGVRMRDALDPDKRADWVSEHSVDFAQRALNRAQDAFKKANPNVDSSAFVWQVKPKG